jgi:hypothetical protein
MGRIEIELYSLVNLGARYKRAVNATPQPLCPKESPCTVQGIGWTLGPVWKGAEILASTRILSPDRVARSELLHRQNYPGPLIYY